MVNEVMTARTNTVSTKDWLRATQGVAIRAYVESSVSTHVETERPSQRGDLEAAIKTAGRREKSS